MILYNIGYFHIGHVLQFEIEIKCALFNFEAYVKLGVFDEDMPNMKTLLSSDAAPIDCEKDEKIEIVGHIAAEGSCSLELCVCQISKRNIARIQAPQNSAKKQRLDTDGSSGKYLAIDYERILWRDDNWFKVKLIGQVFLQVFGRKFLVLGVVCFILPSIFAMIREE